MEYPIDLMSSIKTNRPSGAGGFDPLRTLDGLISHSMHVIYYNVDKQNKLYNDMPRNRNIWELNGYILAWEPKATCETENIIIFLVKWK